MTAKDFFQRCLQFIPVFFGITLLSFGLIYIAPGDPVGIRLSAGGTAIDPQIVERMRAEMGLDAPFLVQYGRWLVHFLQGDMGRSYITDVPVATTFWKAVPYTLRMAGTAMGLTLLISLPLGITSAIMSVLTVVLYRYDKRAAEQGGQRIPNTTLHLSSLLGGWPGALIARPLLRHKLNQKRFRGFFWASIVANFGILYLLIAYLPPYNPLTNF